MPLDSINFLKNLKSAFAAPLWNTFADIFGAAFDTFILSGTVNTSVTGLVTPPSGSTYTDYGGGAGTVTTSGLSALQEAIKPKLLLDTTVWVDVGPMIATAVDSLEISTATVATIVSPNETGFLSGTGKGVAGCIDTALVIDDFTNDLRNAFTLPAFNASWELVAQEIVKATEKYLTGAKVTTSDKGTTPASSWVGSGIGTIS